MTARERGEQTETVRTRDRKREKVRGRQADAGSDAKRQRETDRQTETERKTKRETDRQTGRQGEKKRKREKHRLRKRDRHKQKERQGENSSLMVTRFTTKITWGGGTEDQRYLLSGTLRTLDTISLVPSIHWVAACTFIPPSSPGRQRAI